MTGDYEYKVGGSLGEDAPSYVRRQADSDLDYGLRAGELCYVFNSRQMGKTSLLVRTMKQLQADGFACAVIDISGLGSQGMTVEQWYGSIIDSLLTELNFIEPEDLTVWWDKSIEIAPVRRLAKLFDELLLPNIHENIVIFLDEIDSILRLDFPADDFFALIRSCYQRRSFKAEYRRLTFALVGVATPSDLIKDEERTPFNIGTAIQLYGFKLDEIAPLAKGLEGKVKNPQALMREVLAWTGGQPLLTQKVCNLLIRDLKNPNLLARRGEKWVEGVVRSGIIDNWEAEDEQEHLKTIRDRMLNKEQIAVGLLGLYQQILQQREINVDRSLEEMRLRLTGLVVEQQGRLRVYNQIYANVFDLSWVENELGKLRFYADNLKAWEESEYQDESYLLRGQELEKARLWADGRRLSDADYRFLSASVQAELNQKVEEAEGRQNQALEEERKAKQRFTDVERKTKRQIRIGGSILALFVVGAIVAAIGAISANIERKQAQIVTDLERSSAGLLRLRGNVGLDNLVEAMRSVKQLKQLVKNGNQLKDYPTVSPILALHNTLEYNREINQLKFDGQVRKVVFSPDTKIVAGVSVLDDSTTKLLNLQTGTITTLKHNKKVNNVVFSPDGQIVATASDDGTAKLWNLQGGEIATFKHNEKVNDVAFSPNGQTVGTASSDNTAKLWNLQGGLIATLKDNNWWVSNVVFSPDGQTVATASASNSTATLWNLQGQKIASLNPSLNHKYLRENVVFSPDGKTVVTTSLSSSTAKLWSLQGQEIATVEHSSSGEENLVFSPDSKTIATSDSNNYSPKLWNLQGKEIVTLKHKDIVRNVVFSPDSQTVATASEHGTVKLWNLQGQEIATFKIDNQAIGQIHNVTFSPDGKILATFFSVNGKAKLWNLQGQEIATLKHNDIVNNIAFSPDSKTVTTVSKRDGTAKLWNLQGRIPTVVHSNRVENMVFSPDSKTFATASRDGTAKLWNLQDGLITTLNHNAWVKKVIFSPDGKTVGTVSSDTAQLWNLKGEVIATLKHKDTVKNIVFSPDGKTVATVQQSGNASAKLWNLQGEEIATLDRVDNVVFSPDSKIIATKLTNLFKLWNLEGKEIATLKDKREGSNYTRAEERVVFSPDSKTIGTISSNTATAKLWNLQGKEIATLKHDNSLTKVIFSPDGKTFATASDDGTAKLWNLQGGLIATLKHNNWVSNVVFSPDSKTVVTASFDGTAKLWNLQGQEITTLKHDNWVLNVAFSPDGKTIATGTSFADRTVRLWTEVKDGSWQQFAEYQGFAESPGWSFVFRPDSKLIAIKVDDYFVQLRRVQSLDSSLARGCNDLKEYLASRPDLRKEICPDNK